LAYDTLSRAKTYHKDTAGISINYYAFIEGNVIKNIYISYCYIPLY